MPSARSLRTCFERRPARGGEVCRAQSSALRLAYTSTPFRGLAVLLACFPAIHRRHPNCQLDVFSSMQVYGQAAKDDPYTAFYDQCRQTEGINYRGSVSQPQLAKELAGATMLAYPNTFAETSCIAVMEALAAGLLVVTAISAPCQKRAPAGRAWSRPPAAARRSNSPSISPAR